MKRSLFTTSQATKFGFSRGAYTVRAVANVMNLCGIPHRMPDGSPVPRHGERLRKIASDAVNFVYNHGNGFPRGRQPYLDRREELGRRFRQKYGSAVPDVSRDDDVQGNVQPNFIGVFDTVAALGNAQIAILAWAAVIGLAALIGVLLLGAHWGWSIFPAIVLAQVTYWYGKMFWSQWKYFSPDEENPLKLSNPLNWPAIWTHGHRAVWNLENYDEWLDSDVGHARHAMAIDKNRLKFPRVRWASKAEAAKTLGRKPEWLKQVWFAGCHSDVGGSYLEPESRLSDVALDWMMDEVRACVPNIQVNGEMLHLSPDPTGMQHEEVYMIEFGPIKWRWKVQPRETNPDFPLHPSVLKRLKADPVSHVGEMKRYRPEQLKDHLAAKDFYT